MIKLRKFQKNDDTALAANANSPAIAAYMRTVFPSPYLLSDARWWVAEGHQLNGSVNLVIDLNGECIGNIGFNLINNRNHKTVELGYWLGEAHWGKGFISEAIAVFTDLIFLEHDVKEIIASVASPNVASMKVLEKCGYKCGKINENSVEVRAGVFDEHVFVKRSSNKKKT
ncbi:MAG: hypothetical protein COA96_15300 [SAR86 cluster bacterium]|uniref:N-acetyltransferase domain-containing protein n=1 Tax=SAR86 cluster bacterium TaxID=2030880 RepID=A0A2A5AR36_9GAMM|nr:MAG: hypothetical protein COA96_15300 [SAR86 cluster bacterium]